MTKEERDNLKAEALDAHRHDERMICHPKKFLGLVKRWEATEKDRDQWRRYAREMLAMIHGDGGHRCDEIGPAAATKEAVDIWVGLHQRAEAAARIQVLEGALREIANSDEWTPRLSLVNRARRELGEG
jgi:hypothetical protein